MNNDPMQRSARQWLKARDIVAAALHEWRGTFKAAKPSEKDEARAAAILARLSHAGLLLCEADELKD